MNRTIEFKDADKNVFKLEIEIKEGKLSISGVSGDSCGQCQDSIKPANDEQKRLIEIWNTWHLNDLHAGTEKQEKAIKEWKKRNAGNSMIKEYTEVRKFLDYEGLLIDIHNGKAYEYGTAWLKRDLPENFEIELIELCNVIETQEADNKEGKTLSDLSSDEIEALNFENAVIALGIHLELTTGELDEITEESENLYRYGGTDYFVGSYDDAEEKAMEYLTDDPYLWQEAVKAGSTEESLEEWAQDVVNIDGVGHILNSWDGSEYEESAKGEDFTIIQR